MSCEKETARDGSDCLEVLPGNRLFDRSATAWLLAQAVRYLNIEEKEGQPVYARIVELLRRCGQDLVETVSGLFRQVRAGDSALRWNLLYVLGDAGDRSAADFLLRVALGPLPEDNEAAGCETDRDMELLVCTMAIQALGKVAARYPDASDAVLKVVAARPATPLLVEAVKAAVDLGQRDRVRELLAEDERWILDIRRARVQELFADPEREDGKERGFTPPKSGTHYTAPQAGCCR